MHSLLHHLVHQLHPRLEHSQLLPLVLLQPLVEVGRLVEATLSLPSPPSVQQPQRHPLGRPQVQPSVKTLEGLALQLLLLVREQEVSFCVGDVRAAMNSLLYETAQYQGINMTLA